MDPTTYNKEKLPLEKLRLPTDDGNLASALGPQFSSRRFMIPYYPPPKMDQNGQFVLGAKEEWQNQTTLCIEDFKWLLRLRHFRFWSQIVFQKCTLDGLISFLQEAYPYYSLDFLPNDESIRKLYNKISHLAFALISRLTTRIETEYEWIGEEKYAALLYDNFLLSVPMLLDVCVVFGKSNSVSVQRMIEEIIRIQPTYKEDIKKCIEEVRSAFLTLEGRLTGGTSCGEAVKLSDLNIHKNGLTLSATEDILLYILDVSATLSTFVDFYTEAALLMHQKNLEALIASLYENAMTILQYQIKRFCSEDVEIETYFRCIKRLNLARFFLLKLFRDCISVPLNNLIEQRHNMSEEDIKSNGDSYIVHLADAVTEKSFINDYTRKYSIEHDLEILFQVCPDVDPVKYEYILEYLMGREDIPQEIFQKSNDAYKEQKTQNGDLGNNLIGATNDKKVTGVELDSLVTEVKDILPHLGDGFIMKCLEHYNYSSSSVIDAILENSLPENLLAVDPELPIIPKELDWSEATSALPERVNVFDNDEFDIMSRDFVDKSKIHRGKRKDKHKDLKDMLDDKSHIEELRDMFSKLGNIECGEDGYDDEYDDTYDSLDVSVGEAGETDKRQFTIPRVLRQGAALKEEEEEEAASEPEEQTERNFDAFVENPEVVRQRYEERRMSKQRHNRDVLGKPKGQGQDSDITFNRYKKGVFKSSQGNHNRRKMAQHKKQQGMLPA